MILDVADGSSMQGWASIVLAGTRSVSVGHDAGKEVENLRQSA
jgi:hypothetical protein